MVKWYFVSIEIPNNIMICAWSRVEKNNLKLSQSLTYQNVSLSQQSQSQHCRTNIAAIHQQFRWIFSIFTYFERWAAVFSSAPKAEHISNYRLECALCNNLSPRNQNWSIIVSPFRLKNPPKPKNPFKIN